MSKLNRRRPAEAAKETFSWPKRRMLSLTLTTTEYGVSRFTLHIQHMNDGVHAQGVEQYTWQSRGDVYDYMEMLEQVTMMALWLLEQPGQRTNNPRADWSPADPGGAQRLGSPSGGKGGGFAPGDNSWLPGFGP